ncbi:uncharacterized protein [Malus domestica]|uniref:uncharacterized protein isoform X3 n=1 Tax=Malus domestica TaxID=3750 RepID=UPI003974D3C4
MPRGSTPNNFSFFSLCPPVNLSFLPSSFSFSVFLSLLLGSHFSPFSAPQAHTHRGTRVCEEEPSPFTISSCSLSLSLSFPRPQKTGKRTPARFFNLRLGNGTALFLFLAPTIWMELMGRREDFLHSVMIRTSPSIEYAYMPFDNTPIVIDPFNTSILCSCRTSCF